MCLIYNVLGFLVISSLWHALTFFVSSFVLFFLGMHRKIYANTAVDVLWCPGVSGWRRQHANGRRLRSCMCSLSHSTDVSHYKQMRIWMIVIFDRLKMIFSTTVFFQRNCRYDGQISVFGTKLQDALAKQCYFLVSNCGCWYHMLLQAHCWNRVYFDGGVNNHYAD